MIKLLVVATLVVLATTSPVFQFDQTEALWDDFKVRFNRTYVGGEEQARKQIFMQHLEEIIKHNLEADMGKHSYWQGINHFTDMTNQEFRHHMNGVRLPVGGATQKTGSLFMPPENLGILPPKVDWRKKGAVTDVKNQAQCGSCWAFSTTGSLEGQHFRKTGDLVSLSEQNLVDCSKKEGNMGCEGGLMDDAFKYIQLNNGIDTEACYPYLAEDETCHFNSSCIGATVTGHVDVEHANETALKIAVATVGPVSIAIDASHPSFQRYSHGVYDEPDCSSEQLDHGVLVVGYGRHLGTVTRDFWIVKNSWGETWGLHGYVHMTRNKDNQCGVASQASYPLV